MSTDRQGHVQGDSRRYSVQDTMEAQLEDNQTDRQFEQWTLLITDSWTIIKDSQTVGHYYQEQSTHW